MEHIKIYWFPVAAGGKPWTSVLFLLCQHSLTSLSLRSLQISCFRIPVFALFYAPVILGQEFSDSSMILLSWHLLSSPPLHPNSCVSLSESPSMPTLSALFLAIGPGWAKREGCVLVFSSYQMRCLEKRGWGLKRGLTGMADMSGEPSPSQSGIIPCCPISTLGCREHWLLQTSFCK